MTERINYVFAAVFLMEALIKLIGYGRRYFKDQWNIFDLIIVILTLVGIILNSTVNTAFGP